MQRLAPGAGDDFLANISARSEVIRHDWPTLERSADPDDKLIPATAVAGRADLIVSGDKSDRVGLGAVVGIPIVTPHEARARLR